MYYFIITILSEIPFDNHEGSHFEMNSSPRIIGEEGQNVRSPINAVRDDTRNFKVQYYNKVLYTYIYINFQGQTFLACHPGIVII